MYGFSNSLLFWGGQWLFGHNDLNGRKYVYLITNKTNLKRLMNLKFLPYTPNNITKCIRVTQIIYINYF